MVVLMLGSIFKFPLIALASALVAVVFSTQETPSVRVVKVTAERFDFSPSRISVGPGEEIELRLTSEDTAHGFRVEGTEINVEIPKRGQGEVVVRFRAVGDGPFKFECSRMCGAGHHFMRGEIVVKKEKK
jgi:cytochrome c oxidase subunit II